MDKELEEPDGNGDELLRKDDGETEDNSVENVPKNVNHDEDIDEIKGEIKDNTVIDSSKDSEEKLAEVNEENTEEDSEEKIKDDTEEKIKDHTEEKKKDESEEKIEDDIEEKIKDDSEEKIKKMKDDTEEKIKDDIEEKMEDNEPSEESEDEKTEKEENKEEKDFNEDPERWLASESKKRSSEESSEDEPSEKRVKMDKEESESAEQKEDTELTLDNASESGEKSESAEQTESGKSPEPEQTSENDGAGDSKTQTTSGESEHIKESIDNEESSKAEETDSKIAETSEVHMETDQSDASTSNTVKATDPEDTDEVTAEDLSASKPVLPVNGKMEDDDTSTVRSDDSEKENINADMPMDLSTKSSATSDIITLSEDSSDEDGKMNGFTCSIPEEMTPEQNWIRRKLVKKLQSELRNEEAKLVLLKKMRQSQASQQLQDHSNFNSNGKQAPMKAHAGQPPPLIRGGQSAGMGGMAVKVQTSGSISSMSSSQLMRGHQQLAHMRAQMQGPPPLVMAPRMSNHMMQPQGLRGGLPPGAGPNLIPGFRGQLHQQAQAHSQQLAQQQQQQHQQQQQQQDTQTPAQRQAAAKLALRKQLEKTLLQIPPPKPPPPEMNFIPSLISNEFIMLVGLEEVVNYITDADLIARGEKSPDEKLVCTPFTCIQCDTDFTPVWKREKPGSKHVICEMCVTTNQKKALKQEHTNRLKSAFVKALQQEQEIERMQSHSISTATTTPVVASPVTTSSNMTAPSYRSSAHAVAAAAEQLRHHQNLLQAHQAQQAHLRANQPIGLPNFNPRNPFHYQLPFKHTDLQRQYLLDMIPSRSMAQSNIGWKS